MLIELLLAVLPLLDDRPPLGDRNRFPPVAIVAEQLAANAAYQAHVQHRQSFELHNATDLYQVFYEARQLERCWQLIQWAHHCYEPGNQRAALAELRDLIGWDHYYAGTMPPAIPTWRLQVVR